MARKEYSYKLLLNANEFTSGAKLAGDELKNFRAATKAANAPSKDLATAITENAAAFARGEKSYEQFTKEAQRLEAMTPMAKRAREAAAATEKAAQAERERAAGLSRVRQLTQQYMTAEEKHAALTREMTMLVKQHGLSQRVANRAVRESAMALRGQTTAAALATGAWRTFTTVLSSAGLFLGVGGIVYGLRSIIKSAEEFNQSFASSTAIMGDLSERTKERMVATAREVAYHTKYSAVEATDAYYFLASAGLSADQSIASLPVTAKFAQAGMFDMARATDILTDAQSALGLASKNANQHMLNMKRVGDVTVAAAAKANASVEQFGDALMNKGALAAKLVGMEVEEATSILMIFADKGFAKGVDGGQALWMALRDLKVKAVENKDAFYQMGINVDAGGGKFAKMADIVEDMDKAFEGLEPLEVQKKLLALGLPSKSLAPILTLLGTADQMREYQTYLADVAGTMDDVSSKQIPKLTETVHQMSVQWKMFASEFSKPLISGLGDVDKDVGALGYSLATVLQTQEYIAIAWEQFVIWTRAALIEVQKFRVEMAHAAVTVRDIVTGGGEEASTRRDLAYANRMNELIAETLELEHRREALGERARSDWAGSEYLANLLKIKHGLSDVAENETAAGEALKQTNQISQELGQEQAEATKKRADEIKRLVDSLTTPQEAYAERLKLLDDALQTNAINAGQYYDAVDKAKQQLLSRLGISTAALTTPEEQYTETVNKLNEALSAGVLTWGEFIKLKRVAQEELAKPLNVNMSATGTEAAMRGSVAALDRINAFRDMIGREKQQAAERAQAQREAEWREQQARRYPAIQPSGGLSSAMDALSMVPGFGSGARSGLPSAMDALSMVPGFGSAGSSADPKISIAELVPLTGRMVEILEEINDGKIVATETS